MALPPPDLRVLLDRDDVSAYIDDDLSFSSVDRGGFETASWSFPRRVAVRKGAPVRIELGLETAWEGRVAEPGHTLASSPKTSVACEGHGARLKENELAVIICDRDPGSWQEANLARRVALGSSLPGGISLATGPSFLVDGDAAGGVQIPDESRVEAQYNALQATAAKVYYKGTRTGTFTGFEAPTLFGSSDPLLAADLASVGLTLDGALRSAEIAARTFLWLRLYLSGGPYSPTTSLAQTYAQIAVYGPHGLPERAIAGGPPGFYPDDIVRHVLAASGAGVDPGVIEVASGFVVPQAAYREAVEVEQIVTDQAVLAGGWAWGTWEALGIRGGRPRFDFRALPTAATAVCSRADCDDLQVAERLGDLYDRALVTYDDPAEGPSAVERTRDVPELAEADIGSRTLMLNMGTGTQASAEIFGDFGLALSEKKSRAAGTAQISGRVRTPDGGRKHACLLRPGIDKLRVTDLPDLPFLAGDRADFQLQRVECRANQQGISTSLALGSGPDLIEVLQARLALASDVALFGQ